MTAIYGLTDTNGLGPGFSADLQTAEFDEGFVFASMNGVASDGAIFVFGGAWDEDSEGVIYTSDGTLAGIVERNSGLIDDIMDMRYAAGTFLGVGKKGGVTRSTDSGTTWTATMQTNNPKDYFRTVATDGAGTWIATGGNYHPDNTNGMLWKSVDDGLTWALGDFGTPFGMVWKLVYSPELDRWVAIGQLDDDPSPYPSDSIVKIMYSDDAGETWTEASDYDGLNTFNITYITGCYGLEKFIVGNSGSYPFATSADGDVWVATPIENDPFGDNGPPKVMEYLNNQFVMLAAGWGVQTSVSGEAIDWSTVVFLETPQGIPAGIAYRAAAAVPVPRTRVTWF